jgi:hypothetical protein
MDKDLNEPRDTQAAVRALLAAALDAALEAIDDLEAPDAGDDDDALSG